MKKILLLISLLAVCFAAQAQYSGTLKRSGCSLKMDGQKLTKAETTALLSDIGGVDYTASWEKARRGRTTGIVMTSVGSGVAVLGAGVSIVGLFATVIAVGAAATTGAIVGSVGGEETAQETASSAADQAADSTTPIMTAGLVMMGAGAVTAVAGIPFIVVNCNKMNKIVKTYNNTPALAFGTTGNGLGLTLNF